MPELPEIEIIKRSLFKMINKAKIIDIKIKNKNLRYKIPRKFSKSLIGEKILKISKKKIDIKYDESRERPYDVNRLICNNNKAKKILKWKPRISIFEGLTKSFEWAKKNKVVFNTPFSRWYYKKI